MEVMAILLLFRNVNNFFDQVITLALLKSYRKHNNPLRLILMNKQDLQCNRHYLLQSTCYMRRCSRYHGANSFVLYQSLLCRLSCCYRLRPDGSRCGDIIAAVVNGAGGNVVRFWCSSSSFIVSLSSVLSSCITLRYRPR